MAYDFDTIAGGYDRMNHLMTAGLDRVWRRRAIKGLGGNVLDVACGTGDMVVELLGTGCQVTGVDLSDAMLAIARRKCDAFCQRNSSEDATVREPLLLQGDAEALPFDDGVFDGVTCAFGIRNFVHLDRGLREMCRVLKKGGKMVVVEMSTPDSVAVRPLYNIYTRRVIPFLGERLAGNRDAYVYLPASIERFPKGAAMIERLRAVGLEASQCKRFFGVCRQYSCVKL